MVVPGGQQHRAGLRRSSRHGRSDGVENPVTGIQDDEGYLYVVKRSVGAPIGESGEWTVKVSQQCGYQGGGAPTDVAFQEAAWQF